MGWREKTRRSERQNGKKRVRGLSIEREAKENRGRAMGKKREREVVQGNEIEGESTGPFALVSQCPSSLWHPLCLH